MNWLPGAGDVKGLRILQGCQRKLPLAFSCPAAHFSVAVEFSAARCAADRFSGPMRPGRGPMRPLRLPDVKPPCSLWPESQRFRPFSRPSIPARGEVSARGIASLGALASSAGCARVSGRSKAARDAATAARQHEERAPRRRTERGSRCVTRETGHTSEKRENGKSFSRRLASRYSGFCRSRLKRTRKSAEFFLSR